MVMIKAVVIILMLRKSKHLDSVTLMISFNKWRTMQRKTLLERTKPTASSRTTKASSENSRSSMVRG